MQRESEARNSNAASCISSSTNLIPRLRFICTACAIALLLARSAHAQCPNTAQAIGKEIHSYSTALGLTNGWLKCCSAHFPSAAEDLTRKYNVWAAPGHRRIGTLLKCTGTEASDTKNAADLVQDHFRRKGEQDMCATDASPLHCREILDKLCSTTSIDSFAKPEQ